MRQHDVALAGHDHTNADAPPAGAKQLAEYAAQWHEIRHRQRDAAARRPEKLNENPGRPRVARSRSGIEELNGFFARRELSLPVSPRSPTHFLPMGPLPGALEALGNFLLLRACQPNMH